jgi:hypothetical protein
LRQPSILIYFCIFTILGIDKSNELVYNPLLFEAVGMGQERVSSPPARSEAQRHAQLTTPQGVTTY